MYTAVVLPPAGLLCCICRLPLTQSSTYGDDLVIQLLRCRHAIHLDCLRAMVESSNQVRSRPTGVLGADTRCPYVGTLIDRKNINVLISE